MANLPERTKTGSEGETLSENVHRTFIQAGFTQG